MTYATKKVVYASKYGRNIKNMSSLKIYISVFFAALILSCQKDDTIYYNNITMGNFVEGQFISDQGITYDIVEQTCSGETDTLKRAIISCDVLSKAVENKYNVRLNGFDAIFTKDPVDSTAVKDSSIFVENPLSVGEIWYAGGYLNMYIYIPIKEGSTQTHLINLVRDNEKSTSETYRFTLKHNAFGEVITAEDTNFVLGGTYVSFPIANLIQTDKALIILNWTSHDEQEGMWSVETKKNTISVEWERGGFEHKFTPSVAPAYRQGYRWM